jgi:hypothetical protein
MATAGIIGRRAGKNRASRRKNPMATMPQPTAAIRITAASAAGSVLTVTYDQAVVLNGTPSYATDVVGADPVSAVLTSPTTIEITFDASVAAATELNIPYEEPAVRNSSGGFVSTSTFPV